jgi:Xaa-Pro dipeptidase
MDQRIQQLRELMAARGLEAIVLRLPENVLLCSQYLPRNGFSLVFVPGRGEPWLIAPEGDQDDPQRGTLTRIERFGWGRLQDGDPYDGLARVLGALRDRSGVPDGAAIGLDSNADAVSPPLCFGELLPPGRATIDLVSRVFRTDRIVEVMPDVRRLRAVKLDAELERIDLAGQLAHLAVERFQAFAVQPGRSEAEIAAEVEGLVARAGPGHAGRVRFARAIAQVTSGRERTSAAWFAGMVTTARRTEPGDLVMLELAVNADGYWADLTRTLVAGTPGEEQARLLRTVDEAQRAALAEIRPGRTAGEVDAAARQVVARAGLGDAFCHALGHGVGFAYHDGDPVLLPGSATVLAPGMVFSCEPGVYLPGLGGVRQELDVAVTATGCRVMGRDR